MLYKALREAQMAITVYGIAVSERITYGHGDSGEELRIAGVEPYGSGGFPPIFTTREGAESWIAERRKSHPGSGPYTVVWLVLR